MVKKAAAGEMCTDAEMKSFKKRFLNVLGSGAVTTRP